MSRTLVIVTALLAALAIATSAHAAPVEVPITLTHDVIGNYHGGAFDAADSYDTGFGLGYGTQAAIDQATSKCQYSPKGLPDDGVFPAGQNHPGFQLHTETTNDGNNALQLENDLDDFTVDVDDGSYVQLHVALSAFGAAGVLGATFHYTDASTSTDERNVPWWYYNYGQGTAYPLASALDGLSADGSNCVEYNNFKLWGVAFDVDSSKTLDEVTLERRDPNVNGNRRVNIFGALLLPPHDLSVTRAGAGQGEVRSTAKPGIACGDDCAETYPEGERVSLVADPTDGFVFTGWSGACSGTDASCSVKLDADRSVTATFEPAPPPQQPPQGQPPVQQPTIPAHQPTDTKVRFGDVVSARRSCAKRRLSLQVEDVAGETIVEAVFSIGKRSKRRAGSIVDDPFFFRVPAGGKRFRLKAVMTTADGDTLRTSKRFRGCPKPKKKKAKAKAKAT